MMKLTKKERVSIKQIAKTYDLDLIILFGSRARGVIHAQSDFDIAIRCTRKLSLIQELKLARALDRIFPHVDICNTHHAFPLLLAAIVQDGILLFERKCPLYAEFKIFAMNQYLDFKPELDRRARRNRELVKRL